MLTLCGFLLLQFSVVVFVVAVAGVGHITLPRRVKRQLYAEETMRQCHLNIVWGEGELSQVAGNEFSRSTFCFFFLSSIHGIFFGFLIRNI